MRSATKKIIGGLLAAAPMLPAAVAAQPSASAPAAESPWNGEWVVSRSRNPKSVQEDAAEGYRFHLSPDGGIRWEIPTLGEVVEGRVDGRPMAIHRPGAGGMALAVTKESPRVLHYVVSKDGQARGEGRMTLVEQGQAWVDITQPYGRPDLASVVIYVRPEAAAR